MNNDNRDVEALVRLFRYAEAEANRLGLSDSAQLVQIPAVACMREARDKFGLEVDVNWNGHTAKTVQH